MHGSENENNATLISYTSTGKDGKVTPETLPSPEEAENIISNVLNGKVGDANKILPPLPPKALVLQSNNSFDLNTKVPASTTSQIGNEPTHVSLSEIQANSDVRESFSGESEEPIYATIDQNAKSSKNSLGDDSRVNDSSTPLTPPPSYVSPYDSGESLLSDSKSDINNDVTLKSKKTNRFLPRAKYAMQQKGFIIFTATAIILSTSAALVYLQDKAKFIAFFTNSPNYITIPVIALAAVLAISPILFAIKQFRNTKEYSIQKKVRMKF